MLFDLPTGRSTDDSSPATETAISTFSLRVKVTTQQLGPSMTVNQ